MQELMAKCYEAAQRRSIELNLCALCVLAVVKYQYSYGSYHLRIVFNTPLVAKCSVVIFHW